MSKALNKLESKLAAYQYLREIQLFLLSQDVDKANEVPQTCTRSFHILGGDIQAISKDKADADRPWVAHKSCPLENYSNMYLPINHYKSKEEIIFKQHKFQDVNVLFQHAMKQNVNNPEFSTKQKKNLSLHVNGCTQAICCLSKPNIHSHTFGENELFKTLSQHVECLRLYGGDTNAEEKILESLNGILLSLAEDKQRCLSLLRESGIFLTLAQILKGNPRCAVKTAQVLSELAKNEEMKKPCIEADLILTLIPFLESTDQEMLLHAGRAIGRICYDNRDLQEELVKVGVITSLVRILTDYAESEPLVHVDLLALCNLADLDTAKEALSKTKVAEQLVKQLRRAENHERLEMVFEVLQTLAENDALKVQLVDAGVQEVLSEILLRLQGSSQAEDTCIVKAASDLIVSLLLGDGNCERMVQVGVIHQLLDLLEKHVESADVSVQHAALSALRNLAIPVVNKVQMLEERVAERIQALLRSEMPPVQFKLLGTLRMLADGQADAAEVLGQDPMLLNRLVQWCDANDNSGIRGEAHRLLASILQHNRSQEVVKAIQEAHGVKYLVSMTSSEHPALQNEALNALTIASAINLETLEESFKESQLVQSLHKLLQDVNTNPEVIYNSMSLLCTLLKSGELRQEIEEEKIKESLEQLCNHSNADVVKGAVTTLQILGGEPPH